MMNWIKCCENKPQEMKAVWIQTFQGHINLAWHTKSHVNPIVSQDLFYPYGGDVLDGREPFTDKHGDCDVEFWKYAELPEGIK